MLRKATVETLQLLWSASTFLGLGCGTLGGGAAWADAVVEEPKVSIVLGNMWMVPVGAVSGMVAGVFAPAGIVGLPFVGMYRLFKNKD